MKRRSSSDALLIFGLLCMVVGVSLMIVSAAALGVNALVAVFGW